MYPVRERSAFSVTNNLVVGFSNHGDFYYFLREYRGRKPVNFYFVTTFFLQRLIEGFPDLRILVRRRRAGLGPGE